MTVRPEIKILFSEVFQFDGEISAQTSQENVAKWDSLKHIALVSTIEQKFGISLSMDEMVEMRSVQDISNILERHGV